MPGNVFTWGDVDASIRIRLSEDNFAVLDLVNSETYELLETFVAGDLHPGDEIVLEFWPREESDARQAS